MLFVDFYVAINLLFCDNCCLSLMLLRESVNYCQPTKTSVSLVTRTNIHKQNMQLVLYVNIAMSKVTSITMILYLTRDVE